MSQRATRAKKLGATLLASSVAASLAPLLTAGPAGADPAAEADISGFCDGAPEAIQFTDTEGLGASTLAAIDCILAAGITVGTTPTTYGPTGVVTRGQMASFLARQADTANDLDSGTPGLNALPTNAPNAFNDDTGNVHEPSLNRLAAAGIYLGTSPGTADAQQSLSRAQMAVLINRLQAFLVTGDADVSGSNFASDVNSFEDDDELIQEIQDSFDALGSVGIFVGDGESQVLPGNGLSRAQMALILARHLAVNFEDGAIDALNPDPGFENITVTPEEDTEIAVGATQTFVASGLDADLIYRVTAVATDTADLDADPPTFTPEPGTGGLTAIGDAAVTLVSVNGAPPSATATARTQGAISPVDGEITVVFRGDAPTEFFVVVYEDGGESTRLELASATEMSSPIENFGVSGNVTVANAAGPITLNSVTVVQGSTITGTVADAATVQSLTVSGCGLANQNVPINAAGQFSVAIPASQAIGACTLNFVVARTNGPSQTQAVAITVTAATAAGTNAPDLVSASILPGNVISYLFDEAPNGAVPVRERFSGYTATGARFFPQSVAVFGSEVRAQFAFDASGAGLAPPAAPVSVANFTVATVDNDAVRDAGGLPNPTDAAPLQQTTAAAGITAAPDLLSVGNFRTNADGNLQADFTFDETVAPGTQGQPATGAVANEFFLVFSDNTFAGNLVVGTAPAPFINNAAGTVVTATFAQAITIPSGQIVRGVTAAGAVQDPGGAVNVTQSADVSQGGNTVPAPDLVSASVTGLNQVTFVFDQPVSNAAGSAPVAANFFVYNTTPTATAGTMAVRSATDATVVVVTFPADTVGGAVGANLNPGAVTSSTDLAQQNVGDEVPLQAVASQAGRTSLPDLVSVGIVSNAFGNAIVTYTFDAPPTGALVTDFFLYNVNAFEFAPNVATPPVISGNTATFTTGPTSGFTNAQAADAVFGGVDDTSADALPNPLFPEGGAPITRG